MTKNRPIIHYLSLLSILVFPFISQAAVKNVSSGPLSTTAIAAPVLKWHHGGCNGIYCETGWYSSPAVADLDGDGSQEVIGAAYAIFVLDGATGSLEWKVASGHDRSEPGAGNAGRTWPGVVVADVDGNGDLEIAAAHSDGYVSVYDHQGYFMPGWPQRPTPGNELRSLASADLEGDGNLEIIVASTRSQDQWWVYEHDGRLRPGQWPQHGEDSDTNGYTAGCYNQNVAAGDLDGDGLAEILGPNDTHYLAAFHADGSQVRASSIYGTNDDGTNKFWSRVGVHVDHAVDLRGYANCGEEHRPNFADSAPIIVDVDGNGIQEAVVVGNVYNCGGAYTSLYQIPYILNGDRTRWKAGGFDWAVLPIPDSSAAPLVEDYNVIETALPNPAAADLDGDGNLEILYASYDGRLHAYWLDKSEHGNWPYSVYDSSEGVYRFASEPVVADLDGQGGAEVIFASWVQKHTGLTGRLHVLDSLGNPLHEVDLPAASGGADWNGGLAAPTLANIDGDADLEVVLNTAHSGFVAYDLPGTGQARLLWETGRGSQQRSGALDRGNLAASEKTVSKTMVSPGEILTYTITLSNPGAVISGVTMTDALPASVSLVGEPTASSGTVGHAGGVISWSGDVGPDEPVTIAFQAQVDPEMTSAETIVNIAEIDDGQGTVLQREARTFVNGEAVYFPLVRKGD